MRMAFSSSVKDAIVSYAQPKGARQVAVQRSDIARPNAGEMQDRLEKTHRGRPIKPANIAPRFLQPLDSVRRH
jgi:hypothetical protein